MAPAAAAATAGATCGDFYFASGGPHRLTLSLPWQGTQAYVRSNLPKIAEVS